MAVVIPVLDPRPVLAVLVRTILEKTGGPLVLVDDGSGAEGKRVLAECEAMQGVTVLRHERNCGKGRALKTAFAHLLEHEPKVEGCVTADGDGEHAVEDILRCAEVMRRHPDAVVLGCRGFTGKGIPLKSRWGNLWMQFFFLLMTGRRFRDTQTGLRGLPRGFLEAALKIPGERFEYETEMLLRLEGRDLVQVPVQTLYAREEGGERATHFRPFRDTMTVLKVVGRHGGGIFLRFVVASLASFGVDIGLFHALFEWVFPAGAAGRLFWATVLARLVSMSFNYACNQRLVFRGNGSRNRVAFPSYLALAAGIWAASYLLTKAGLAAWPTASATGVKCVVDVGLFLASYLVQRAVIFRPRKGERKFGG